MDYLRTKREDKETFEFLIWILGIATVCAFAGELELFSNFKAKGLFIKIIAFLTTEIPSWIWSVISTAVTVTFLVMLKNGLPGKIKSVSSITISIIAIECIRCWFDVLADLEPKYEYIQTIVTFIELLMLIILGYLLRKNYQGKIKTLGTIFIVFSAITIFLFLILAGLISSDYEDDDYYYYDKADKAWQTILSIIFIAVFSFLEIFPWWYESKLLIEGTKYLDYDEDAEETVNDTPSESLADVSRSNNQISNETVVKSHELTYNVTDNKISSPIDNLKGTKGLRKKSLIGIAVVCVVICLIIGFVIGIMCGSEVSEDTENGTPIDKEIIMGDFDGDGEYENIWIEGKLDSDGMAVTPFVLKSDNPKFDGLSWDAPYGVMLYNLGKLDNSDKDFIGAIPEAMSNWESYHVYRFNGKWKEMIEPFSVYMESDLNGRVEQSRIPGYVRIYENDMSSDDPTSVTSREVRLNK